MGSVSLIAGSLGYPLLQEDPLRVLYSVRRPSGAEVVTIQDREKTHSVGSRIVPGCDQLFLRGPQFLILGCLWHLLQRHLVHLPNFHGRH
jgi:hypothetical protein